VVVIEAVTHQVFAPDFMEHVTKDLSRTYAMVFAAAAMLVATTFIPVWLLPMKPTRNLPALAPAGTPGTRT
jgi:hypothetical protein